MKKNLLLPLLFVSGMSFAQHSPQNSSVVPDKPNSTVQSRPLFDPNQSAELRRQIGANKTGGYIFAGMGAAVVATGITTIASSRNDQEGLGAMVGTFLTVIGALHFGASVPFFIRANRKKKELDELQNIYSQPQ